MSDARVVTIPVQFPSGKEDAMGGTPMSEATEPRAKNARSKISEAIREEILQILYKGSEENEGALTPDVLSRVERVAHAGRELLVVASASQKNLAALVGRRRRNQTLFGLGGGLVGDSDDVGMDEVDVLSPASPAENFGTTAIRELVAGLKHIGQTPESLVRAIAAARDGGLDDVAKKLEAQLGVVSTPMGDSPAEATLVSSAPPARTGAAGPIGYPGPTGPEVPSLQPASPGAVGPTGYPSPIGSPESR